MSLRVNRCISSSTGMAMVATVVVRHRLVRWVVAERMLDRMDFKLHARAGRLAEHGSSHRTPDGKQDDQHKEQPEAKRFHDGGILREGLAGQVGTEV
jgi:hypothetical protein